MKRKTVTWALASALGFALATGAGAQTPPKTMEGPELDQYIEQLRKAGRAEKSDLVAKAMKLDATQAAAFWPIYKAYEAERKTLGDQRLAVYQDLAEHFDTLNDAKAKGLLDRAFVIEEQRLALEKKYKDTFLKALPAKVVARFFQVDSRINNLVNLDIASAVPLVN
jgi:hypothetical protein